MQNRSGRSPNRLRQEFEALEANQLSTPIINALDKISDADRRSIVILAMDVAFHLNGAFLDMMGNIALLALTLKKYQRSRYVLFSADRLAQDPAHPIGLLGDASTPINNHLVDTFPMDLSAQSIGTRRLLPGVFNRKSEKRALGDGTDLKTLLNVIAESVTTWIQSQIYSVYRGIPKLFQGKEASLEAFRNIERLRQIIRKGIYTGNHLVDFGVYNTSLKIRLISKLICLRVLIDVSEYFSKNVNAHCGLGLAADQGIIPPRGGWISTKSHASAPNPEVQL
jgi:hypothetical protein